MFKSATWIGLGFILNCLLIVTPSFVLFTLFFLSYSLWYWYYIYSIPCRILTGILMEPCLLFSQKKPRLSFTRAGPLSFMFLPFLTVSFPLINTGPRMVGFPFLYVYYNVVRGFCQIFLIFSIGNIGFFFLILSTLYMILPLLFSSICKLPFSFILSCLMLFSSSFSSSPSNFLLSPRGTNNFF